MVAEQNESIRENADEFTANQEVNPMAEMLDQYLSCRNLERGQIVNGVVVHISPGHMIVDIGGKCEGVVPERDLETTVAGRPGCYPRGRQSIGLRRQPG